MPIPIISTTTSIQHWLQHEGFGFQPLALNSPTSWSATPLPPGVTINAVTGLISGAATLPGVYEVAVRAANDAGVSAPLILPFCIESSVADPDANVTDLLIDLDTRLVRLLDAPTEGRLFAAKRGDTLLLRVRFVRRGIVVPLEVSSLGFALKQYEPETILVESASAVELDAGVYLVPVTFTGDALLVALADRENDKGTEFTGLGEFSWVAVNALGGPATIAQSSQTFSVGVIRDLKP